MLLDDAILCQLLVPMQLDIYDVCIHTKTDSNMTNIFLEQYVSSGRMVTLFSIGLSPLYFHHIHFYSNSYPLPASLSYIQYYILFQDAGNICGKLCCLMKFPLFNREISGLCSSKLLFFFNSYMVVVDLLALMKMWLLIKREYFI